MAKPMHGETHAVCSSGVYLSYWQYGKKRRSVIAFLHRYVLNRDCIIFVGPLALYFLVNQWKRG